MNKRVTIKEVATRANVSYQTVSKVMNGRAQVMPETEARIWEAAQHLGYRPNHSARNLRTRRSQMIGYSWITAKSDPTQHVLDMFLTSMVEEAEAAGYHLLPFPYREGVDLVSGYRELISTGKVDGFVISSVNYHDPRARFLLDQQFPFVAFGRSEPEMEFAYVDVDGGEGMRLATEHLIAQGHRRIAALAWLDDAQTGNYRLAGYLSALKTHGLAFDPALVARGEGTVAFGHAATEHWLRLEPGCRPTAIVAVTDIMAIGAMRAGQAHGLTIGRDLSVVGFDDTPMDQYLSPSLSSVRQPIREAGRKCVEILVALLRGPESVLPQVLLRPELIVRQSSGPAAPGQA